MYVVLDLFLKKEGIMNPEIADKTRLVRIIFFWKDWTLISSIGITPSRSKGDNMAITAVDK